MLSSQAGGEAGGVRGAGGAGPRRSSGLVGVRCNIYSDWATAVERPADTDDGVL